MITLGKEINKMAIYTTKNFGMLTAEPLDSKHVMTDNKWDADDLAGLSYPGQIFYDPETGWFRVYSKDIDRSSAYPEHNMFALGRDGVYIWTDRIIVLNDYPEIDMYSKDLCSACIVMYDNGTYLSYSGDSIDYISDYGTSSTINFSNSEIVFGNSNTITSNTNNKVISMIGTGLEADDPYTNQLIIGQYNESDEYASFIIGNGTDASHRHNIIDVYNDSISIHAQTIFDSDAPIATYTIDSNDMPIKNFYLHASGDDILSTSSPQYGYNSMPIVYYTTDNFITGIKIKIYSKYDSTAKLNIFLYRDTTTKTPTKYILQNYPIGNLNAGDLAIEELLEQIGGGSTKPYLKATITGLTDTTKGSLDLLIQYCNNW